MANIVLYGECMTTEVVKVDKMGRIYLPSSIRDALDITRDTLVKVETIDDKVIITKTRPVAEEGYGVFRLHRELGDIDKELEKAMNKKVKKWLSI